MPLTIDDQFDQIAQEAGNRASAVKCTIPEYVEGLKGIISHFEMLLDCAEGDLEKLNDSE